MNTKSIFCLLALIVTVKSLHAEDPLAKAELKGGWIVIYCPKDEAGRTNEWTAVIRADAITSMDSFYYLRDDTVNPVSSHPVIRIRTGEMDAGGKSRTIEVPAGTKEAASGLLMKLMELIDRGRASVSGRE